MKPLKLNRPYMILLVGIPGSGKTFFGKKFASTFNASFVESQFYKNLARDEASGAKIVNDVISKIISSKLPIVIEGFGHTKRERKELMKFAEKNNHKPLFVWVQTDPVAAADRVAKRTTNEEFQKMANKFQPLGKEEPHVVISGKHTYQTQVRAVLRKIADDRPPLPAITLEKNGRKPIYGDRL